MRSDKIMLSRSKFLSVKNQATRYGLMAVVVTLIAASQVMAATLNWDNGGGDGKWDTAANWTDDTVPASGDIAKVGNWASANAISTVDQVGALANIIYIGDGATTTGNLQVIDGELQVGNLIYVGYSGDGTITMTGGRLLVTNDINFGYFGNGYGANIVMSGGYLESDKIVNSWNSPGKMVQSGGTNIVRTQLQMGWNPGITAEYELSGGLLEAGEVRMGAFNNSVGIFTISGGVLDLTGSTFQVAYWGTSTSTCYIAGGSVTSKTCNVGRGGTGYISQTGGTNSIDTDFNIGVYTGSTGTYSLCGGVLELGVAKMNVSQSIYDSNSSYGEFLMGDATGTGILRQKGATSSSLTVRGATPADGLIRGWGNVELTGTLENNGRVIADGYGIDRDLCFTNMSRAVVIVTNTTVNGWYAQNHGKLQLPPTYNWFYEAVWGGGGVYGFDDEKKAINSVKLDWVGSAKDSIVGALLASDHSSVPKGLVKVIGCWEFSDVDNAVVLTFNYDAALAADLGADENDLLVWRYDGSKWVNVTAAGGLDIVNNTITSDSVDANALFAIGMVPKGTTIIIR